jgi:hypothetical protein
MGRVHVQKVYPAADVFKNRGALFPAQMMHGDTLRTSAPTQTPITHHGHILPV